LVQLTTHRRKKLGERQLERYQNTTGDEIQLRPIRINPILEMQAALDRLFHEQYVDPKYDNLICRIDPLSLNVRYMLLYYPSRTFGSFAVCLDELTGGLEKLDSNLIVGFSLIEQELP